MKSNTLAPELLDRMDAYWRAANYLSVGQIYLYDNPLLKRPLTLADVKHLLLGHWRNSKPRIAGVPGLDPRGRRVGLFARPFVRGGVRRSQSRRRLRRRRRRGGNRTAGHGVAFQ